MGDSVVISSKYQVVIPKSVRERAGLRPGQRLMMVARGNQITMVPLRPLAELRGFIKGARLGEIREEEDRL